MSVERRKFRPGQEDNFVQRQMPSLTERALQGNKQDKERAAKLLLNGIKQSQYFDSMVLFAGHVTEKYLFTGLPARRMEAASLLGTVFTDIEDTLAREGERILHINKAVVHAARVIIESQTKLNPQPGIAPSEHMIINLIRQFLPEGYRHLTESLAPGVIEWSAQGLESVKIRTSKEELIGDTSAERIRKLGEWNSWLRNLTSAITSTEEVVNDKPKKDRVITILKKEPEEFAQKKPRYERIVGGMSLRDLATGPLPFLQVGKHIEDWLQSDMSLDIAVAADILLSPPTSFIYEGKRLSPDNRELLKNLNDWQRDFVIKLLRSEDKQEVELITSILQRMPKEAAERFVPLVIYSHVVHPHEYDGLYDPANDERRSFEEVLERNQLAQEAYQYSGPVMRPRLRTYAMASAHDYFMENIAPELQRRLEEFGVLEKFNPGFSYLDQLSPQPESNPIDILRGVFENNCKAEGIQHLIDTQAERNQIVEFLWGEITKNGIDILPVESGAEIIDFEQDENAGPGKYGITSLALVRSGESADWKVETIFSFRDSDVRLIGVLDPQGTLEFPLFLNEELPHIYSLLKHIALVGFHDITLIRDLEEQSTKATPKVMEPNEEYHTRSPHLKSDQDTIHSIRRLPRQRSARLIRDTIRRKTRYTPRIIPQHPVDLPGAKNYREAVRDYQYLVSKLNGPGAQKAKRNLEEAREAMYKISSRKLAARPHHMKLHTIVDPISGDIIPTQSWKVEHQSPKPKPGEEGKYRLERHWQPGRTSAYESFNILDES